MTSSRSTTRSGTSSAIACCSWSRPGLGRGPGRLGCRRAEVALSGAKAERSTCAIYAQEHDEHSIDRLALAAQLRRGIDRGELVVHYQPKVPLNTSAPCSVEAL